MNGARRGLILVQVLIAAVVVTVLIAIFIPYLRRTVWRDPQAKLQEAAYREPGKVFTLDCVPAAGEFHLDELLAFDCIIGNTTGFGLVFNWELFLQSRPATETVRGLRHHLIPEPAPSGPILIPGGGQVELRFVDDGSVQMNPPRFNTSVGRHDSAWIYADKSWRRLKLTEALEDTSGKWLVSGEFSFSVLPDSDTPRQSAYDTEPGQAFEVVLTGRGRVGGGISFTYTVTNRTEDRLEFQWCDTVTAYTDESYEGEPGLLTWHRSLRLLPSGSAPSIRLSDDGITFRAQRENMRSARLEPRGKLEVTMLVRIEAAGALP